MSQLLNRIRKIPHLFGKLTVCYCIAFVSGASIYSLRIVSRTNNNPAPTLAIIIGFFGGELFCLCLKTILTEKPRRQRKAKRPGEEQV